MAHPDKVPEGGKFREVAAAALDGTAGAFGDGDLLCVARNAGGELVVGTATTAIGVIWTREGKRSADDAGFKDVVGGKKYTVFRRAEFVEMEQGGASPAAGATLFAAAAGGVGVAPGGAGSVFVGWVDSTGNRLILDVGAAAEGTA